MTGNVIHGLSHAEYIALPGVNSSAIKWGLHTMQHMRAALDGDIEDDSNDKQLGRAIHCRILEPEEYTKRFPIATRCQHVNDNGQCKNNGKLLLDGEWFCGVRGHAPAGAEEPEEVITREESQRVEAVVQALHNADCMHLLARPGWSEAVLTGEYCGVPIKGRVDRLSDDMTTIIDLKKCQRGNADDEGCQKQILNYEYDVSAALYCHLVKQQTGQLPEFYWVFVEDKPPHAVNVIRAGIETLQIGLTKARETLTRWKRATNANQYPGHVISRHSFGEGGLPGWYREKFIREQFGDLAEF